MKIPGLTNRHRIAIYAGLFILLLLGSGLFYEVKSDKFRFLSKEFLESMCDRRIEVGEASFNLLGWVTLKDVRIYNRAGYQSELLLHAPKVRFMMGMTGGETSAFRPTSIRFESPNIWFERPANGKWNTDSLWVKKPPRTDHPTFQLPITISHATIALADSQVGSGLAMMLKNVNIDHTVISDGAEIKNSTLVKGLRLPEGGKLDITLSTHPNAGVADAVLTFKDAAMGQFRAYFEFLKMFNIKSGVANGTFKMKFRQGVFASDVDLDVAKAVVAHPASKLEFHNVASHVAYRSEITETRVYLTDLSVRWFNSTVKGAGIFNTRRAPDSFVFLEFEAEKARAEDLSFLLCDPSFTGRGEISGRCENVGGQYTVNVDLDRADVRYGEIFRKLAGVNGDLLIEAGPGGLDLIDIHVAQSHAQLTPHASRWKLELPLLYGADVANHLTFFARLKDFSLTGPLKASFDLEKGGLIKGEIDFTDAQARLGNVFTKPKGDAAQLRLAGRFSRDRVDAENWLAQIGKSQIGLSGSWTPDAADLQVGVVDIEWSDARKYMPAFFERIGEKLVLDGVVRGLIDLDINSSGQTPKIDIDGKLDLTGSRIEIVNVGRKERGLDAGLSVKGAIDGERLLISSGDIHVQGTRLALAGDLGATAYSLVMKAVGTELDGLKTLLASQLWSGLRDVTVKGPADLEISLASQGDAVKIAADLSALGATLTYGDTWSKPAGELFKIRTQLTQAARGTNVERIEFRQGTSTLLCEGHIEAGRPALLEASMRANLDVPNFVKQTPGLARIKVGGRKASQALELIADNQQRAALTWKLSGSIEEPKLALMMDQIVSRAIANSIARQLKAIASVITMPLRMGTGVLGAIFGGGDSSKDSAPAAGSR